MALSTALPDDPFREGLEALRENRVSAALDALTRAEREKPDDARIRNFRGVALASLGRTDEAEREYREAIRIDPDSADAHRNLGFLYWTEHKLDQARDQLQVAIRRSPDDAFAHYYLGRVDLDGQRYATAFQQLDRSGIRLPSDSEFLLEAAAGYLALGRQSQADAMLQRLRSLPLNDTQSVRLASLMFNAGNNAAAVDLLRSLQQRRNSECGSCWAEFDLSLGYLRAGQYEAGAVQARKVAETLRKQGSPGPEVASASSVAGIAYARIGQDDLAVKMLREAADAEPLNEEHWLNLTRELMELRRYSGATSAVRDALAANPNSYALHLRLGATYLSSGHYPEAETEFRELADAGDPLPTSYVGLAQVLMRTGRNKEAAEELGLARDKLGPNFLIAYFEGLALDRAANREQAVKAFQEAVQLNPNSADALVGLGKTDLALNRLSAATTELKEALRLSPSNLQARRLLSHAYALAGDKKNAEQYAAQTSEPVETVPEGDLIGDFLLPEWRTPAPRGAQ